MANQYWVGSDTSWNTAANWASSSGGSDATGPPGSGDDVIFDGGGTNNCTLDTSPTINSIDVQSGYTGLLDFSDASRTVAVGNVTLAGTSSTIDLGNSDWTISGNWDSSGLTTVASSAGQHIDLAGTSKTVVGNGTNTHWRQVTISGSYTAASIAPGLSDSDASVLITGTFTFNGTNWYATADITIASSGTLQGSGQVNIGSASSGSIIDNQGGTWDVVTSIRRGATIRSTTAGLFVFQKNVTIRQWAAADYTVTFEDDCQFNALAEFYATAASQTYTMDLATNNVSMEFRGDVNCDSSGATLAWSKGSGTLTFTGGNSQSVNFLDLTIEDISVDKSAGTLTFTDGFTTDSFTAEATDASTINFADVANAIGITGDFTTSKTSGEIDCGDATITISGNFSTLSHSATWTRGTSTIILAGTSKTFQASGESFHNITVSGTYTDAATGGDWNVYGTLNVQSGGNIASGNNAVVYGVLTIDNGGTLTCGIAGIGAWTVNGGTATNNGTVTGPTQISLRGVSSYTNNNVHSCSLRCETTGTVVSLNAGTIGGVVNFRTWTGDVTVNLTGDLTCSSSLLLNSDNATKTLTVNTSNYNITCQGDVTPTTTGAIVWNKGSGTITFSGANSQSVDFNDLTIEDIVVGKSAGTLTFTGGFTTDSYTQNTAASTVDFGDVGETYVISGDFIASAGNIDFGAGNTINIYGDYNTTGMAGYGTGSSYVQFYGTSKTWRNPSATGAKFHRFMAGSSYTTGNTSGLNTGGTIEVNGTFTVDHTLVISVGHVIVGASGHLGGSGTVNNTGGDLDNSSGGTWDVASTLAGQFNKCDIVNNSVFSGTSFNWRITSTGSPTLSPPANVEFDCNVTINSTSTGVLTVDCSTNNTAFIFKGNVTLDNTNFIWTKGSGSMTFSGANDQSVNLYDNTVEDIIINKSAGRVTLTGGLTTDWFYGIDGDFDLNGQTMYVVGDVECATLTGFRFWNGTDSSMSDGVIDYDGDMTLAGWSGAQLLITDLDFVNSTGDTSVATYCTVTNSIRTGTGSDINATAASNVNGGGNTGWDFGGVSYPKALGGDVWTASLVHGVSFTDLGEAGDAFSVVATYPVSLAEKALAGDVFDAAVAGAVTASATEKALAGETFVAVATYPVTFTEKALAGDVESAATIVPVSSSDKALAGDSFTAVKTIRYWIEGTSGNWEDSGNWSDESGGTGGASVPGPNNEVVFDSGGVGNCTVNGNVEIKSYSLYADDYTGTINWQGYDATVHGNIIRNGSSSGLTRESNVGSWTQDAGTVCLWHVIALGAVPDYLTIDGCAINNVGYPNRYTFCQRLELINGTTLSNGRYAPGRNYTGGVDPFVVGGSYTVTSTAALYFYSNGSYTQSGFTTAGDFYYNYPSSLADRTMTMTGNLSCKGLYLIGGSNAVDESTSCVLDMNGHNLTCSGGIYLGANAGSGYRGKLKLGSGTHDLVSLQTVGGAAYGYIDFGSSNTSFSGNVNLTSIDVVGVDTSTITFDGATNADWTSAGESLNDVSVNKVAARLTLLDDAYVDNFDGDGGDCDLNGFTVNVNNDVLLGGHTGFRLWNGTDSSMSDAVIDYGGSLTIYGLEFAQILITDLDFVNTASDTSYVEYATVTNSIRTGTGPDIVAYHSLGNIDNGGNSGWQFHKLASLIEKALAGDSFDAATAGLVEGSIAEEALGGDSISASISTSSLATEKALAGEAFIAALTQSVDLTDEGLAGDAFSSTYVAAVNLTDEGLAGDAFDAAVAGVVAGLISELAEAGDAFSAGGIFSATIGELAEAGDVMSAASSTSSSLVEGASAGDAFAALSGKLVSIVEKASAGDAFSVHLIASVDVAGWAGHANAGDAFGAIFTTRPSTADGALAGEAFSASLTKFASLVEKALANDFIYTAAAYVPALVYRELRGLTNHEKSLRSVTNHYGRLRGATGYYHGVKGNL